MAGNKELQVVVCRRRFRASPATIFDALTQPELLGRWFSPSEDIRTEVRELDLREGGNYRFGFHFSDGAVRYVRGAFREIVAARKLAYTWTWEEPDPHAGIETLVTIQLVEHGDETEVVIHHQGFPDDETRQRHDDGWRTTLDRLEKYLEPMEGR